MHFSTILQILFIWAFTLASAAPLPIALLADDLEVGREFATLDNNFDPQPDSVFDDDGIALQLNYTSIEDLQARSDGHVVWVNEGGLNAAMKKQILEYVAHLAEVTCNISDFGLWHGCGKSNFEVGDKVPQTSSYCQSCPKGDAGNGKGKKKGSKHGKKETPAAASNIWITNVHPKGEQNKPWIRHTITIHGAHAPDTKKVASDMLGWIQAQLRRRT